MRYKLGEICEIVSGSTPKTSIPEYWDGDVKWITPAELNDDSYIINDSVRKITELGVKKTGLSLLPVGTVILSSRAPIGKVAIAGCEMYCNQGFKNLICSDKINNRYLFWFLKGNTVYLNSLGRGATFKEISKQIVSSIEISVPSIKEQENAVSVLEQISDIIQFRKQEIKMLDDLIKARFVEMLKNERTTPRKLKDIVEQDRIITYGMVKPGKDVPGGVIIIKVKDFPNGIVETGEFLHADPSLEAKYERSRVKEGDLLYSIRGTVGRTAFVTKELVGANITQDTARLSIARDRYNANYIRYALGYDDVVRQIESQIKGVAMKGISLSELREIEIPCVKYGSQQEFGAFVEQVDKSKVAVQKALDEAQILFDSLMQKYFG